MHGPKDVTPSEELVAIAAASAAAAAAHTTQMSQGHPAHARQLTQQPSVASLQHQLQQDSPSQTRPGQPDTEALNRLARLQQTQPSQVGATRLSALKDAYPLHDFDSLGAAAWSPIMTSHHTCC